MGDVVIVGGARTPVGRFGGAFKEIPASELGAVAIRAAVERSGVAPGSVDGVIMGNVFQAAETGYAARRAMLAAGLPDTTTPRRWPRRGRAGSGSRSPPCWSPSGGADRSRSRRTSSPGRTAPWRRCRSCLHSWRPLTHDAERWFRELDWMVSGVRDCYYHRPRRAWCVAWVQAA